MLASGTRLLLKSITYSDFTYSSHFTYSVMHVYAYVNYRRWHCGSQHPALEQHSGLKYGHYRHRLAGNGYWRLGGRDVDNGIIHYITRSVLDIIVTFTYYVSVFCISNSFRILSLSACLPVCLSQTLSGVRVAVVRASSRTVVFTWLLR